MQKIALPPLAVTCGDPAGIGPDITIQTWVKRAALDLPAFAYFGDASALAERAEQLGHKLAIARIERLSDVASCAPGALPVVHMELPKPARAGQPDAANGATVIAAIEAALAQVVGGNACAVVTNPISKNILYAAGFKHPGHTEFLAELATRHMPGHKFTPVMMLACDELRVVPLTVHIPLASVAGLITRQAIIETARIVHAGLVRDFGIAHPRIAVAGLNPHAGESGTIGREDEEIVRPAIELLRQEGLIVSGPHSADTLFHAAARETYDAAIAMYHDQALIPIKTLAFDRGVNMTLGLPFVRTSPDHGTAFDIAGTGRARPESFIEALLLARRAAQRRAVYAS
jgi:4-hydroxythreonine-4-phosphate dehydrogenase